MRLRPESPFALVADPDDVEDVRLICSAGEPIVGDTAESATGEGAGWAMLPFLHYPRTGGRFTDGTYGAYYCSSDQATAIAETRFHFARFLTSTKEEPQLFGMRTLEADIDTDLVDIRGHQETHPHLYDPDPAHYPAPQAWARVHRAAGVNGIVYDSVRRVDGECVALFRPRLVQRCRPAEALVYEWNGSRISAVYALVVRGNE